MITRDQNGSCWCCVDGRGITRVLLTRINAVALRQISMHGLILSLDSSHWLLILIYINECMNYGSLVTNRTQNARFWQLLITKVSFITNNINQWKHVQNISLKAMHCGKAVVSSLMWIFSYALLLAWLAVQISDHILFLYRMNTSQTEPTY